MSEAARELTLDDAPETLSWYAARRQLFDEIFERERGRCYWCSEPVILGRAASWEPLAPNHATLDHLRPRSRGGRDDLKNVVLACNACNNWRGDMSPKAFRRLRKRVAAKIEAKKS